MRLFRIFDDKCVNCGLLVKSTELPFDSWQDYCQTCNIMYDRYLRIDDVVLSYRKGYKCMMRLKYPITYRLFTLYKVLKKAICK